MEITKVTFQQVLKWTDYECKAYLEQMRWASGVKCPKCGATEPYRITRKSASKNTVSSLYKCRACKRQFTSTVGTIFEDSKIPLSKWFAAIKLMCASKKGISAHQLHRQLDITYKSAWFMCHRIREAMRDKITPAPFTGTVEADETYIGGKPGGHRVWKERIQDEIQMGLRPPIKHRAPYQDKTAVFGMIERGGMVRTIRVKEVTARALGPILRKHLNLTQAHLITDGNRVYTHIKTHVRHDVIDHEIKYVRGDIHIQGIESYWSLLKRGL